mgnify:CR=1 FL=1
MMSNYDANLDGGTFRTYRAGGVLRAVVCAVAPLAFVWFIGVREGLDPRSGTWVVVAGLTLFFGPFTPFSFPALAYQEVRDNALLRRNRLVRALTLIPWLCLSPDSTVRAAHLANLGGLVAAWAVWVLRFA